MFNVLSSHSVPVNPGGHEHRYPSITSVHVPPFSQGELAHSSISAQTNASQNRIHDKIITKLIYACAIAYTIR
jgi:hypothetical protein